MADDRGDASLFGLPLVGLSLSLARFVPPRTGALPKFHEIHVDVKGNVSVVHFAPGMIEI